MYRSLRTIPLKLLIMIGFWAYPATIYPFFSYFNAARDLFASRVSEATDEEIAFLEAQESPMAHFEAMYLRATWADYAHPFVSASVSDALSTCIYTPLNYIGAKTGFNTLYKWFAKKITYKEVLSAMYRGVLAGAVIFSVNEIAKKKLHPQWVKNNYYARTVASKIGSRIAVAVGMGLLGACAAEG